MGPVGPGPLHDPIRIFHNLHNLLYNLHDLLYNSSPPIIRYPKVPSYKILDLLYIINSGIVIFGIFLSCIKRVAHHKSAPKGVNFHQNPPFIISLAIKKICISFLQRRIFFIVFIYYIYKMERLVEMKIAKFNILSILNCYYRLFSLIYISYDSEGITIQGSCEE